MTSRETNYAIVTGGGSGLGRALCLRLAAAGWTVAVCDCNESAAEETRRQVVEAGGSGLVQVADVTQPEQWAALGEHLRAEWPRLDLLVNNAGVSAGGEAIDMSADDWRYVLDVNLHGVIHGCRAMVPWLIENPRGGHLINTASVAGLISPPGMAPYNVSKAAVVALSETLYGELKSRNVGVTVLCPGFFSTNLLAEGRFAAESYKQAGQQYMDRARFTADDIARLALKAMHRKQLYVVHDFKARWLWRIKRWRPARFHRIMARVYRRTIKK